MNPKCCFWLFLYLMPVMVEGQVSLRGQVLSMDGVGIPHASVYAHKMGSSSTSMEPTILRQDTAQTWTITNLQGEFRLQLEPGFVWNIRVRAMGFAPRQVHFQYSKPITDTLIRFYLDSTSIRLEAVEVAPASAASVSNLSRYSVSEYGTGLEQTLYDFLRNLNGVQVDEGGRIHVAGQAVRGVLFEGEDLLGRAYPFFAQTLGIGAIREVQVLYDYEPDPFLRVSESSPAPTLNLVFHDAYKGVWFGRSSLGLSPEHVTRPGVETQHHLTKYTKPFSLISYVDGGNTGMLTGQTAMEAEEANPIHRLEFHPVTLSQSQHNQFREANIPDNYQREQKRSSVLLSARYRMSGQWTFKTRFRANREKVAYRSSWKNGMYSMRDINHWSGDLRFYGRDRGFHSELIGTYAPSRRTQMEWISTLLTDKHGEQIVWSDSLNRIGLYGVRPHQWRQDHGFNFAHAKSEKSAFRISVLAFQGRGVDDWGHENSRHLRQGWFGISTKGEYVLKHRFLNSSTFIRGLHQTTIHSISWGEGINSDASEGRNRLRNQKIQLEFSQPFWLGSYKVSPELFITRSAVEFTSRLQPHQLQNSFLGYALSLETGEDPRVRWMLRSSRSLVIPEMNELYEFRRFETANLYSIGYGKAWVAPLFTHVFRLQIGKMEQRSVLTITSSLAHSPKTLGSAYTPEHSHFGSYVLRQIVPQSRAWMATLRVHLDHYMESLSSNLRLSYDGGYAKHQEAWEGHTYSVFLPQHTARLMMRTYWNKNIHTHVGLECYQQGAFIQGVGEEQISMPKVFFDKHLRVGRRLKFYVKNESCVLTFSPKKRSAIFLSELRADYAFRGDKFGLNLQIWNLADERTVKTRMANYLGDRATFIRLKPRTAVLSVNIRF